MVGVVGPVSLEEIRMMGAFRKCTGSLYQLELVWLMASIVNIISQRGRETVKSNSKGMTDLAKWIGDD